MKEIKLGKYPVKKAELLLGAVVGAGIVLAVDRMRVRRKMQLRKDRLVFINHSLEELSKIEKEALLISTTFHIKQRSLEAPRKEIVETVPASSLEEIISEEINSEKPIAEVVIIPEQDEEHYEVVESPNPMGRNRFSERKLELSLSAVPFLIVGLASMQLGKEILNVFAAGNSPESTSARVITSATRSKNYEVLSINQTTTYRS